MTRCLLAAVLASAAIGTGCGEDTLALYCAYGAVSQDQLDGCVDHVSLDEIENRDTNAARFARGEIDECLADSGPFCED